jgi:hypothetical protein
MMINEDKQWPVTIVIKRLVTENSRRQNGKGKI